MCDTHALNPLPSTNLLSDLHGDPRCQSVKNCIGLTAERGDLGDLRNSAELLQPPSLNCNAVLDETEFTEDVAQGSSVLSIPSGIRDSGKHGHKFSLKFNV